MGGGVSRGVGGGVDKHRRTGTLSKSSEELVGKEEEQVFGHAGTPLLTQRQVLQMERLQAVVNGPAGPSLSGQFLFIMHQ